VHLTGNGDEERYHKSRVYGERFIIGVCPYQTGEPSDSLIHTFYQAHSV
jgi:hypothetical protein